MIEILVQLLYNNKGVQVNINSPKKFWREELHTKLKKVFALLT
jgi:hypothetical protein